jgi:hypothetical protein
MCNAAPPEKTPPWLNMQPGVRYVGSKVCAACHRAIYETYRRTAMGRALDLAQNDPGLKVITKTVAVYDRTLDRYYEASREGDEFFQSEYQLDRTGQDVFRAKHKLEYAIGSGINGIGYVVRRGAYLFEAPLTWYTQRKQWDLSPGYQGGDRAFSRPIESACILCHSGKPAVSTDHPGLFGDPAFYEMPIGCENCHGPGSLHAQKRGSGRSASRPDRTIVNPAHLSPRLAEEICINCHQGGDVRVLQPAKEDADFRPGMHSASISELFKAPVQPGQSPEANLLEYHFEMKMSKCFRASGGSLSCLTCHDPHQERSGEAGARWFRGKCLTCHAVRSCTASRSEREGTTPADNCVACHMARRTSERIPHSALSEHRIVRRPAQPFPDAAFHQTTPDLPDLIWVNRPEGAPETALPPDTLIEAYALLAPRFPQYRAHFLKLLLARMNDAAHPLSEPLWEALAREAALDGQTDSDGLAIAAMQRAIALGARGSAAYLDLSAWLKREQSFDAAAGVLEQARARFPFDRGVSRSLIDAYGLAGRDADRKAAIQRHLQLFPEDTDRFKAP